MELFKLISLILLVFTHMMIVVLIAVVTAGSSGVHNACHIIYRYIFLCTLHAMPLSTPNSSLCNHLFIYYIIIVIVVDDTQQLEVKSNWTSVSVASIVLCDVVLYCLKLFRGSLTYEMVFSAQVCDVVFCQHQLTVTNVYSTRRMLPIV